MSRHKDARRLQESFGQLKEIPWSNANAPTYTLDRQIAQARREMGEARWKQLMAEWD